MGKYGITYQGSNDPVLGMPLGGLGTSTLEIGRDGAFRGLRLQNVWEMNAGEMLHREPLLPDTPLGTFFSVHVRSTSAPTIGRILQLKAPGNLPGVAALEYTGRFPFVDLEYQDAEIPCAVSLEAFSPFVPQDVESSSLPLIFFTFQVRNTGTERVELAVAFSWCNDIRAQYSKQGWPALGNLNECVVVQGNPAVRMFTLDSALTGSEYCLAGLPTEGVQWQSVADWWPQQPGRWVGHNVEVAAGDKNEPSVPCLSAWRSFLEQGELPPESRYDDGLGAFSQHQPVGAVSGRVSLAPGESREIPFALIWYFLWHYDDIRRAYSSAKTFLGHRYAVRFPGGTRDAAAWAFPRKVSLRERSLAWRRLIEESSLPPHTRAMIVETLYLLIRITRRTADDRFFILESVDCPRVNAVVLGRYWCSTLAALFPELHSRLLRSIADAQLDTGEIPSTLGINSVRRHEYRLFNAGDVAIFPLSIAWQILWNADPKDITDLYPVLKKTLLWGKQELDLDGDGVPDVHGVDQGWDTFPMDGCAAYIADQWMAALMAGTAIARLCHDAEFADWCETVRRQASETVENKLWNGHYYDLSVRSDTGKRSSICFTDQFTYGTVAACLLNLGHVHPPERVRAALESIWRLNVRPIPFVCRAGSNPDGSSADQSIHKDQKGGHSQSNCFSPVMAAPLACAAIQNGMIEEGIQLLEAMSETIIHRLHEPWSGKLMFDSQNGEWFYGIHYSDCLIVWDILYVLLGVRINAPERALEFAPPRLPVKMPLFSTLFLGQVSITESRFRLENAGDRPYTLDRLVLRLPHPVPFDIFQMNAGAAETIHSPDGKSIVAERIKIVSGGCWDLTWSS